MVAPSPRSVLARPDEPDQADEIDEADGDAGNPDEEIEAAEKEELSPDLNVLGLDGGTDLVKATPFLLPARAADLDAMRLLLAHDADPLATTREGNTALTLASGVVFLEGGFGQFAGPPKSDVSRRFGWRWSSART